MPRTKCPTCGAPVQRPRDGHDSFPFCSQRCRTIDLGHWIDERYRVADEPVTDGRWPTES